MTKTHPGGDEPASWGVDPTYHGQIQLTMAGLVRTDRSVEWSEVRYVTPEPS